MGVTGHLLPKEGKRAVAADFLQPLLFVPQGGTLTRGVLTFPAVDLLGMKRAQR